MRLRQLEYLAALERWGSYARAAEHMYISQPGMSMAIRDLEKELGCRLVHRTGRGVEFTPRGRLILEQAQAALRAVQEIESLAAQERESGLSGRLRIGALPHLGATAAESARGAMARKVPKLAVELTWGDSRALAESVYRGDLDLALVHSCELDMHMLGERRLLWGELSEDELCLMAAEGHPLAGVAAPLRREDLEGYPFFAFRDYAPPSRFGYGETTRGFDDMAAMRRAMAAENALALLPRRCLEHGNGVYQIRFAALPTASAPQTKVLWLHGPGLLRPVEQLFLDELRVYVHGEPRL